MTKPQPIDHALAGSLLRANERPRPKPIRLIHIVNVAAIILAGYAVAIGVFIGATYVLAEGGDGGGGQRVGQAGGCNGCSRGYHRTPRGNEVMIIGADKIAENGGYGGGDNGGGGIGSGDPVGGPGFGTPR